MMRTPLPMRLCLPTATPHSMRNLVLMRTLRWERTGRRGSTSRQRRTRRAVSPGSSRARRGCHVKAAPALRERTAPPVRGALCGGTTRQRLEPSRCSRGASGMRWHQLRCKLEIERSLHRESRCSPRCRTSSGWPMRSKKVETPVALMNLTPSIRERRPLREEAPDDEAAFHTAAVRQTAPAHASAGACRSSRWRESSHGSNVRSTRAFTPYTRSVPVCFG